MQATQEQSRPSDEKTVEGALSLLNYVTEKLSEDAKSSLYLRNKGIDTQMSLDIEKVLENPIQHLLDFGTSVNAQILGVVNTSVKAYFLSKKEYIKSAFEEQGHPLHFYIILNEDNRENRSEMNEFFDYYFIEDYSDRFPVIFTYTTPERAGRIAGLKKIEVSGEA